jgi:hypothetical protein
MSYPKDERSYEFSSDLSVEDNHGKFIMEEE